MNNKNIVTPKDSDILEILLERVGSLEHIIEMMIDSVEMQNKEIGALQGRIFSLELANKKPENRIMVAH